MPSRRFNLITAASLLMLVSFIGMLLYSVFIDEWKDIRIIGSSRTYGLSRWKSSISVEILGPFPSTPSVNRDNLFAIDPRFPAKTMGFSFTAGPVDVDGATVLLRYAHVPVWFVLLAPAILPFFWMIRFVVVFHRQTRTISCTCVHCSYNLTGNITGVCPECGNEFRAAPADCAAFPARVKQPF